MGPYRPEHAALRIEWALKAGWHFEGVVSERDAARLEGLPGDLRGATVNIRDLPDLTMYAAELRYMSKGARRRTGKGEKAAHAEKLQAMKDALGMDRLPGMVLHFGAADLAC
jgi:hypothetical protein